MKKIKLDIIGMCHLLELPGDPNFKNNIQNTLERAKKDLSTLQSNGITRVLFSNEFSYPYTNTVEPVTAMSMAYIIGELKKELSVPFGVDCMYDPFLTIDLAIATEAEFYRITIAQSTIDDYSLGKTNIGKIIRHANSFKTRLTPKILLNASVPFNTEMCNNNALNFLSTIITQVNPYSVCLSSDLLIPFINDKSMQEIKAVLKKTLLYCDGGCNAQNLNLISNNVSGIIIGKSLKEGEILNKPVSANQIQKILKIMNKE